VVWLTVEGRWSLSEISRQAQPEQQYCAKLNEPAWQHNLNMG
jgi:hypothetical protein